MKRCERDSSRIWSVYENNEKMLKTPPTTTTTIIWAALSSYFTVFIHVSCDTNKYIYMQHVELIGIKLNFLSWEGSRIYSLITFNDETEEQETDARSLKLQQQNI